MWWKIGVPRVHSALVIVLICLMNKGGVWFPAVNGFSAVALRRPSSTTAITSQIMRSTLHSPPAVSATALFSERQPMTRRGVFGVASMATVTGGSAVGVFLLNQESAQALYSTYARREQDWENRKSTGDVKFSSAADLRKQLADIVPQNSEQSRIFCPNGPSAAVSPLMENKCGDRLATPSVFGRTEDVLGNSIPGFSGGLYTSNMKSTPASASTETLLQSAGGFPAYKK